MVETNGFPLLVTIVTTVYGGLYLHRQELKSNNELEKLTVAVNHLQDAISIVRLDITQLCM